MNPNAAIRAYLGALGTHPVTTLVATVGGTTAVGLALLGVLEASSQPLPTASGGGGGGGNNEDNAADGNEGPPRPARPASGAAAPALTWEQARLRAMIENAKQSSWRENLDNATLAQERFMLPGRDHGEVPAFVRKIDERSEELLRQDERRLEREAERSRRRKVTRTKMW